MDNPVMMTGQAAIEGACFGSDAVILFVEANKMKE